MLTSRGLADRVGDGLGIGRASAQLHLATIRIAGEITFKGYGRGAAAMTPLDASRLLIAATGSNFAKDSAKVLERFAKLKPMGRRRRLFKTLEECLALRIGELPMDIPPPELDSRSPEWHKRFNVRRLAETALQLLDPMPNADDSDEQSRFAILRWLDKNGHGQVAVFGPDGARLKRGTEIPDLLDFYAKHPFFQVRIVRRQVLVDIASALKGVPTSTP